MKAYTILHVPGMSFFSKSLYRDVGVEWKGTGLLYLFLLLAVCWALLMLTIHLQVSEFIDKETPAIVNQIPRISIVNGSVSISEQEPYTIKEPGTGKTLAVFDTTGNALSPENAGALVIVSKTKVTVQKNTFESRVYDLSQVQSFTLDKDRVKGWMDVVKKYIALALYPFALLFSFLYRVIQALIYGAIGMMFASYCKVKLSYDAAMRLAVVSATPCIILSTVMTLTGVHGYVPYTGLWFFIITLVYLQFGVRASGQTEEVPPM